MGPTNSGKSKMLNVLIEKFITAVSNKSFTTHYHYTGIITDIQKSTQLILYDLPSF